MVENPARGRQTRFGQPSDGDLVQGAESHLNLYETVIFDFQLKGIVDACSVDIRFPPFFSCWLVYEFDHLCPVRLTSSSKRTFTHHFLTTKTTVGFRPGEFFTLIINF